jgi:hypothetical protein
LLESPLAYFNGHRAPEFTDAEKKMLMKYVENGGFILAEACCGSKEFDRGFRALMEDKELFGKETPLTRLPADHPIYQGYGKGRVSPEKWPLWCIQRGCKTVLVYSPRDLSCLWEANEYKTGDGQEAFLLGANIVAYATGLEPPLAKGTTRDLRDGKTEVPPPGGYVKLGQVRHDGDWHPAPRAMPNLMRKLLERGVTLTIRCEELPPSSDKQPYNAPNRKDFDFLHSYKLFYMHGRKEFTLPNEAGLKALRFNLE